MLGMRRWDKYTFYRYSKDNKKILFLTLYAFFIWNSQKARNKREFFNLMEGIYKKFRDNFIHNSETMSVFSLRLRTRQGYPLLCYFYSIFTVGSSLLARARKQEKGKKKKKGHLDRKGRVKCRYLHTHFICTPYPIYFHSIPYPKLSEFSYLYSAGWDLGWNGSSSAPRASYRHTASEQGMYNPSPQLLRSPDTTLEDNLYLRLKPALTTG